MIDKKEMVYGKHSVEELVKNNKEIILELYVIAREYPILSEEAKKDGIKVVEFPSKKDFDSFVEKHFSKNVNHQNILCHVKPYEYTDLNKIIDQKENALILILDHITDVANFGAIIRSAVAFDVDAIVIPKDRSVEVTADVFKTSSGYVYKTNIVRVTNLAATITELKEKGFWVYGASGYATKKISEIQYPAKTVMIVGAEDKGISQHIEKQLDDSFKIPISNKAESLNVSVATGICLFYLKNK